MFELPQIPLFPFESTSITVTTTVWIGVMITVFFNLRFGWTLSALVVPGYVVPLLMSRPTTAIVILAEGIVTYFLAIWISEANRNRSYWSSLFGRDRFFLIVVTSILVRAIADGWLLPLAGRYIVEQFHVELDYRNELGSFGLIAVALLANYFWKPGIRNGLATITTSVALTWAAVAWILVPLTNFNVSSFHFLYEDISVSMLTSPKAYVTILVTGWFASWMNLRYSWDFSGILIPALIALLWAQPERILLSLLESGLILLIGKLLMTSTPLRNVTMQGGRKLAFYFTVCFLFRFVLAHVLSQAAPEAKVTDFFGMGYLLSTLIAIKIDEKRMPLRITGGILQVSAVGAVGACLIGFALNLIGVSTQVAPASASTLASANVQHSDLSVSDLFKDEKLRLYRSPNSWQTNAEEQQQLEHFRLAIEKLKKLQSTREFEPSNLNDAADELAKANFELLILEQEQLLIREREPYYNRGWFILCPNGDKDLCVIAERAVADQWTADSAIFLSQQLGAKSLAVAGSIGQRETKNAIVRTSSPFLAQFRRTFGGENSLLVRSTPPLQTQDIPTGNQSGNTLAIQVALTNQLDLHRLKGLVDGFEVTWNSSAGPRHQNESSQDNPTGHATLFLAPEVGRKLAIGSRAAEREIAQAEEHSDDLELSSATQQWLNGLLENVSGPATNQYRAPKQEELLLIEKTILKPIFRLANQPPAHAKLLESLRAIDHEATSLGYRVQLISDPQRDEKLIVFHEQNDRERRLGWGSVVLRCGLESSCGIEVLRPQYEQQTFEFAASLFNNREASVLLVAGARPDTNQDGSSDLLKPSNRTNFLNHCRQLLLRELGGRYWLTLQARAMKSLDNADIAIATDHGSTSQQTLSPAQRRVCESLTNSGLTLDYVDGRQQFAGYRVTSRLTDIATTAANKENMSLWLSTKLRKAYQRQAPQNSLDEELRSCGLDLGFATRADLIAASATRKSASATNKPVRGLPTDLRKRMLEFCDSHDIVQLYATRDQHPTLDFKRFYDRETGSTMIVIVNRSGNVIALVNPRGLQDRLPRVSHIDSDSLQRFFCSRSLLLEVE